MSGKAYFCCIQFSFSTIGRNISIISSNSLNGKIVKYIHTDSTLDIYIENGNLSFIQIGTNSTANIGFIGSSIVEKTDVPAEALEIEKILIQ